MNLHVDMTQLRIETRYFVVYLNKNKILRAI